MATFRIPRHRVKATLDAINQSPWRVFTADVVRRSTVYLRYPPRNMTDNGAMVRVGDHAPISGPDRGNPDIIIGPNGRRYNLLDASANRRPGEKIVLQAAGEKRTITVKNYDREKGNQSRHAPEPTGTGRNYDPLEYDLYPLAGFYNDGIKVQPNGQAMIGRFGQWRPYTQICMRGITEFRALGHRWIVTDPPCDGPIEYPTVAERAYAREHVVTESGMSGAPAGGGGVVATPEAWEVAMGITA